MDVIGTPLAVSLIGLAIIVVTILAFCKPGLYAKSFPFLVIAVAAAYLVCFVWNCALLRGETAVIAAVGGVKGGEWKLDAMQAASNALHATQLPIEGLGGILVCASAYLCLLRLLPVIRDAAKRPSSA